MSPSAEVISGADEPARGAGVELQDGEIVILSLRPHWSGPLYTGLIPTLALGLALAALSAVRTSPLPPRLTGVLAALALVPLLASVFRHTMRRYVLTDRRVVVRDGIRTRQISLSSVRAVMVDDRLGEGSPGDVTFRSEQGVLMWQRAPEATEVARIASDAVHRYGRR
jgi:hypothetical protein